MTTRGPIVWVLHASPDARTHCQSLLLAEPHWAGQVVLGDGEIAISEPPSNSLPGPLEEWPEVILLDRQSYETQEQSLQNLLKLTAPAVVWLLEDGDSVSLPELNDPVIQDYLFQSQLRGDRLALTIRNLWRQHQLQHQLDHCRHLEELFKQAGVGINQVDASGRYTRVNQRFCDWLGYSEAELLQRTYQDVTHPDDLELQLDLERQLSAGEIEATTFEKRYATKHGDTVWARVTLSIIQAGAGCPVSNLAIVEDIGDRIQLAAQHQQVEADLRQQRNLLRTFLDNLPYMAWLKDREGRFIATNAAFGESCGFAPEELVGKTDYDIWPPELAQAYRDDDAAVIALKQQQRVEEPLVAEDGRRLWIDTIKTPVFGEGGEIVGTVGIAIDVTDRKQAEADLSQSKARLLESQELAHLGHWEYDPYTGRSLWSKELLRQYGLDETIQGPPFEEFAACVHPEDWPEVERAIQTLMTEGTPYALHHRIVRPDGTVRFTLCKGQAIWDEQGQVVKTFGVSQDVTNFKQAEEALRRSEQKHRALVEAQPDLLIHMTSDGVYLDFFAASNLKVVGATEDLIGCGIYEQGLPHDLAERRMGHIRRALATGEVQLYEQTIFNGDENATEEVRVIPVDNHEVLIMVRDVTEKARLEAQRQQAEAELRASQEFVQQITDSSPNVIYIYDIAQQRNVFVNREVYTFLGYTREEAMARNEEAAIALMHPDDQDRAREYFASLITLAEGDLAEFEYRMQHKDGEWRWFLSRDRAFRRDETGQVTQVLGNAQDITPLKQSQLALQQANAELEAIFAASPDLLFRIDREGVILDYKASAHSPDLYAPPEEFLGRRMAEILPEDIGSRFQAAAQQTLRQQTLVALEYQLPVAGQEQDYEARLVPFQNQQVIATIRNISTRKQAERALQISEERLRFALDAAHMGNWDWDMVTDQIVWSESLERMMGLAPGSFNGSIETLMTMIYPDDRQWIINAITRSIEQSVEYDLEFRFIKPDGSIHWAASKGNVLRNAAGNAIRMAGVDMDITDRKKLELALRESEATLTDMLSSAYWSSIVRFRVFADGNWEYDYQSPGSNTLFGYTPDEILADKSLWIAHVYPEDLDTVVYPLLEDIFQGNTKTIEFRYHHKDGSLRWIAATYVSRYDEMADCWVVTGLSQDISDRKRGEAERKQAEIALQESERLYAALTEHSPVGVYQTDLQGNALYVNPMWCQLAGLPPTEVSGPHWARAIHPEDREQAAAAWYAATQQQVAFTYECRFQQPTGEVRWIYTQATPLIDDETGFAGYIGTVTDITEQKQAEAHIQEISQRLSLATNAAQLGIWDWQVAENRLIWDERMYELYGMTPSDAAITYDTFQHSIYADDHQRVGGAIRAALAGEEEYHLEFRIMWPDGQIRFVEAHAITLRDAEGKAQRMIGVNWDISDRKQAEIALVEEAHRRKTLFDTSVDGIVLLNMAGQMMEVNPSFAAMLGYSVEEAMTLSLPDFDPNWSAAAMEQKIAEADFCLNTFETCHRRKDGSIYDVEISTSRVDWNGTQVHLCICRDISDRKQAELALQHLNEALEDRVQQRTQALARSERDLRTIFNNVYDAIFVYDLDGTILDVNDRALEISGATRDQLVGAGIVDLSSPEAPHGVTFDYLSRAQAGETLCFEWQNRRFDDNTRFETEVTLRQVNLWDRTVLLAGVRDIRDRKQAEQELQESRNMLQLVLNAIPQRVFWKNHESRFLGCNPAFAHDYQLTQADIIGKTDSELPWAKWADLYGEDDRQVIATQTPRLNYEKPIINYQGKQIWIRTSKIPLTNSQGEIIGILGCYDDITQRKQAEAALHDSEERLRLALIASNQGMFDLDVTTGNAIVSPTYVTMLGYNPANFQETNAKWIQRLHPDDRERVGNVYEAYVSGEISDYKVELRQRMQDGTYKWILSVGKIVAWDDDGQPLRMLGTHTDISDIKRAEQALREINAELENRVAERTVELVEARDAAENANQAKSIFLANMSHELRTPLNAILGFSQLMGRDPNLSYHHVEELKIINRSGEHLLSLINDILQMSKIEAGQATLNPENFNLPQLLNNLVDMLRLKAESKGLSFTLTSHPDLPQHICTDSHKLRQVLLNLLSNAIKFTQAGCVVLRVEPGHQSGLEPVTVKLPEEGAFSPMVLRFAIEDSGAGIAPEEMNLLFQPFVQTASGRLSQEGTGLGLPISYQFVQIMGGDLIVHSQPDVGSTFAFEIPVQIIDATAIKPAEVSRQVVAIAPGQPIYRILVVEDNWANQILLQSLLTDIGFLVKTAVNGQEAVDNWQTWQPHLIFMDIRMPIMNGYEATREIRDREQLLLRQQVTFTSTKIISLTAGVFEDDQANFDQLGFDDLIRKPLKETDITRTIARHLEVEYLYKDEALQTEATALPGLIHLTAEVLKSLPPAWLTQFHTALIQLNQAQMLALINDLPPEQATVAQTLHYKVNDFDYELLLDLIQTFLDS
ncbi:PAS domain S-box protein [Nodosilinea sp. LEGE 07298]|uniref:PAS domain S-box protein n=1 Tax=Nodosilinea sp. LEGE 07298 TaxID=2777970 RepID=UPI001D13F831|nr:PAS domain S-box protein [Nodosilinea sp. LEGE 07298]